MDKKFTVNYYHDGDPYAADFETLEEAVRFAAANITEEFQPDVCDAYTGKILGIVDEDGFHTDERPDDDGWDDDGWDDCGWNEDYDVGYDPYTGCFSDDC